MACSSRRRFGERLPWKRAILFSMAVRVGMSRLLYLSGPPLGSEPLRGHACRGMHRPGDVAYIEADAIEEVEQCNVAAGRRCGTRRRHRQGAEVPAARISAMHCSLTHESRAMISAFVRRRKIPC